MMEESPSRLLDLISPFLAEACRPASGESHRAG
jgi:hypothetical protein